MNAMLSCLPCSLCAFRPATKTVSTVKQDVNSDGRPVDEFTFKGYDERSKAEILAAAKNYKLMKKRDRLSVVDDSYHRYAFEDPENVPKWFVEDDERHRVRMIPATKQDIEEMRTR